MLRERLILAPKDPLLEIAVEPLRTLLLQQQMVGEALSEEYGSGCYQVGAHFFEAFLFLGCSPSIELDPNDEGMPFCYLQFESSTQCEVVTGSNLKAACKVCKQRYGKMDVTASECVPEVTCPHCGAVCVADEIAWRKSGVVSRSRISLWNIFEGGAVPSDLLLGLLERETGVKWSYAYVSA